MGWLKKLFGKSNGSASSDPLVNAKWPSNWEWHGIGTARANSPEHFRKIAQAVVRAADRQTFPVIVGLMEVIPSGERDGRTVTWSGEVRFACPRSASVGPFLTSIDLSPEATDFKKTTVGIGAHRQLLIPYEASGKQGEDFERIITLFTAATKTWRCNWD